MNERGTIYRFGDYELCPQKRELLRNGKRVKIQQRIFSLLAYLVANSDRAITKEELIATVWEGKPISETVIPRAIMKARRAVGDDGDPPRIIRTIRGYGYRFTETPEMVRRPAAQSNPSLERRDTEDSDAGPGVSPETSRRENRSWPPPGKRWLLYLLTIAVLAVGIVIGDLLHFAPNRAGQESQADDGPQRIQLMLLPLEPDNENLRIMMTRVAALLSTRLSTVPWIEFADFSGIDHPNFTGRRVCLLTIALDKNGSDYSLVYSLTVPTITPVRGTLTDENPFLSAEKLVMIVTDFTGDLAEAESPPRVDARGIANRKSGRESG